MTPSLPVVLVVFAFPAVTLPTEVWQVAPDLKGKPGWASTQRTRDRAVLLVPGLKVHPFRPAVSTRPELHGWEEPTSELVRALAKDFDVYAFGYAQTVPLDVVAHAPGLREAVGNLRKAGYKEIVLIGHSAGGVIARLFVEAYPDSGVTKVIPVAAPHAGSELADIIRAGYPKVQAPFIQSLSPEVRCAKAGKGGETVEMACVVCKLRRLDGDGVVKLGSQWPEECQKCGVPAVLVPVSHWDVMHSPAGAKAICDLAREKLTRWNTDEVEKARKVLFGAPDEPHPRLLGRRKQD